jgi:hypothetical protein
MPTAPVAAASLVAGYGLARATGIRPLGGLVFAAGTGWCASKWRRRRGSTTAAVLVGVQIGAFGASHALARKIGAWPSVLTVAGASAAAAAGLGDRHR